MGKQKNALDCRPKPVIELKNRVDGILDYVEEARGSLHILLLLGDYQIDHMISFLYALRHLTDENQDFQNEYFSRQSYRFLLHNGGKYIGLPSMLPP